MTQEYAEEQHFVEIPHSAGLMLFKKDSIQDKCIPVILEYLIEAGFELIEFRPVHLTSDMARRLYEYDELPELNDFQYWGLQNITGDLIFVALVHKEGNSMTKLASMKGQPHDEYGSSIRGTYSRRVTENPKNNYFESTRQVARNRVHIPMNDHEVSILKLILSEINIKFK